jgi:hypothetical protein
MIIQRYMNEPLPFQEFRISMQQHIINDELFSFIRETPIPKAQLSGIGKLNNPAKRRV